MNKCIIETPSVGEILKEEFLDPLNITPYRLSKEINVSTSTILDIVHNRRKITVEMALRLSKFFGNSHKFWLNLQNEIEAREAKVKMARDLEKIHLFIQSA
jgi:addiction module HigA family antidote